jgi:hypothetical protein
MQKQQVFCHPTKKGTECHGPCKSARNPKTVAIAHENGHKRKNDEFLDMPLKHVLSVMDLVNHSGTPKLWAIAIENGSKMQKQRVFAHASQKCTEWHGRCKSPRNPKTVGNSSGKQP